MMDNILTIENVTKCFPGVVALNKVSMSVRRGEVLGLVGENGAGKSTLIKIITGAIQPDEGSIVFEDVKYGRLDPVLSRNIGVAAIYQELTLAPTLSVAENIFMGQRINHGPVRNRKLMLRMADELLNQFGLKIDPKSLIAHLSLAHKQLVEITKAIAKNAKLIIMDEPTAPLTDDEVDILVRIVHELKARGVSIIFITHRLDELYRVADRVTVLRDGEVIATKRVDEVTKAELIFYMVGRHLKESFANRNTRYGDVVLEVKDISGNGVHPVSFSVRQGEVLGIAGLVGAGRTELVRLIFGAEHKTSGEVYVNGRKAHIRSPKDAVEYGIGYVSEDRKLSGALLRMTVAKNITLPIVHRISKFSIVNKPREKSIVSEQVARMRIRTPNAEQKVENLSGGNQQKVVLAKWLASNSQVLILDEPTRGIDVGAKQEIYAIIDELSKKGLAVLIISSDMEEILGLTDRMLVLYEGKLMKRLEKGEYSQERVLQYASGELSLD